MAALLLLGLLCLHVLLPTAAAAGACAAAAAATPTRVLVVYDSLSNHTAQLAASVADGAVACERCEGTVQAVLVQANASGGFAQAAAAHGVAFGSPVFYGNPSAALLQWVVDALGPGWGNGTFADTPASVFATGGGIHQGTEGVLASLTRAALNFGFRMVTPRVARSGYYSTLGASAVTGTAPWSGVVATPGRQQDAAWLGPHPHPSGQPVAKVFLDVGAALGQRLALAAEQERRLRCGGRSG